MNDYSIDIRAATAVDAPALAAFGERTFRDAFAADNQPSDVESYVSATYSAQLQREEIDDPARVTLLAERDGALVAYAQLRAGEAPACVLGPAPIELLRFYVDRPLHGRGAAHTVMRAVIGAAVARHARTIWLGVWERNPRAIAFYTKSGFRDVGSQPFMLGADRQTDRIMARLTSEAMSGGELE